MSYTEKISGLLLDESKFSIPLTNENAGCFGEGRSAISLLNIETTSDILGLSAALSWTQRSAMFMYPYRILAGGVSPRIGSINSKALLLFHKSHA